MKYGGNKSPEHRAEIADHLAERDGPWTRPPATTCCAGRRPAPRVEP